MIHTLKQAEKYFDIENKWKNSPLESYHHNSIMARIIRILNYIRVNKKLIKYDLIDNQNDVLIYWEDNDYENLVFNEKEW